IAPSGNHFHKRCRRHGELPGHRNRRNSPGTRAIAGPSRRSRSRRNSRNLERREFRTRCKPLSFTGMSESAVAVTEVASGEVVLVVNGIERRIPAGWTLADYLASLELDARTVVIERNGIIVRDRSSFASLELASDDVLEIVHFVGGG